MADAPQPPSRPALQIVAETVAARAPWVAGAVGLFTVPKSGTQWMRLLLANYLARLYLGRESPIGYHEMHDRFLPNVIDSAPARYFGVPKTTGLRLKPPHPMMASAPVTDVVSGHICDALDRIRFPKLLLLYRNPLDNFVSIVHYGYLAREAEFTESNVGDVVPLWASVFVPSYLRLRKLEREGRAGEVLALPYEAMIVSPTATFESVLRFIGVPVDASAQTFALEAASFDAVRRYEEQRGPIHQEPGATLPFARSGRVGQWRSELKPPVVDRILDILDMFRIALDEFVVEPTVDGLGAGGAGR